jgi:hypothetical protein
MVTALGSHVMKWPFGTSTFLGTTKLSSIGFAFDRLTLVVTLGPVFMRPLHGHVFWGIGTNLATPPWCRLGMQINMRRWTNHKFLLLNLCEKVSLNPHLCRRVFLEIEMAQDEWFSMFNCRSIVIILLSFICATYVAREGYMHTWEFRFLILKYMCLF